MATIASTRQRQARFACGVRCSSRVRLGIGRERGCSTSPPGPRNVTRPAQGPLGPFHHCVTRNETRAPSCLHFVPRPLFTLGAMPACALSVGRYPATLAVSVGPTPRPRPVRVARRPMAPHEREGHHLRSGEGCFTLPHRTCVDSVVLPSGSFERKPMIVQGSVPLTSARPCFPPPFFRLPCAVATILPIRSTARQLRDPRRHAPKIPRGPREGRGGRNPPGWRRRWGRRGGSERNDGSA